VPPSDDDHHSTAGWAVTATIPSQAMVVQAAKQEAQRERGCVCASRWWWIGGFGMGWEGKKGEREDGISLTGKDSSTFLPGSQEAEGCDCPSTPKPPPACQDALASGPAVRRNVARRRRPGRSSNPRYLEPSNDAARSHTPLSTASPYHPISFSGSQFIKSRFCGKEGIFSAAWTFDNGAVSVLGGLSLGLADTHRQQAFSTRPPPFSAQTASPPALL